VAFFDKVIANFWT